MEVLDWFVVALYMLMMLGLAVYLGRSQRNREDYYLGGHGLPGWALASSIIATQCSTNSLLGAPAFVGFVIGGGMLWLQYELAVPLAMLLLCFLFVPISRSGVISIYAYLEQRLGRGARLLASGSFLLFRGVATGVTVYGVASVLSLITELPFLWSVMILMGITVVYDTLGGMKAVVVSDVLQMLLLLAAVLLALGFLLEPMSANFDALQSRSQALVNDWGVDGNHYGFWPMLFGGLFLYVAYYGCDQSQAQRLLSARDTAALQRILFLNGVLRFPLVLAYCLLGLGLAAYAMEFPDFIQSLPLTADGKPNLNLVFPAFVAREFAPGLAGLAIVGLFAAAMSSIDSALNSLSASTLEDFVSPYRDMDDRQLFLASKLTTLIWGLFIIVFSFQVESIAPTVLEAINKIGSMANGPLLALFVIAVFMPRLGQSAAITGFFTGIAANLLAWSEMPLLSWLWWNPIGFGVSLLASVFCAWLIRRRVVIEGQNVQVPAALIIGLLTMFATILLVSLLFNWLAI